MQKETISRKRKLQSALLADKSGVYISIPNVSYPEMADSTNEISVMPGQRVIIKSLDIPLFGLCVQVLFAIQPTQHIVSNHFLIEFAWIGGKNFKRHTVTLQGIGIVFHFLLHFTLIQKSYGMFFGFFMIYMESKIQ